MRSILQEIVSKHSSSLVAGADLRDDMSLSDDLGLDSIAIVEVLLECEQRFGSRATQLLDGSPITVGRLLESLANGTSLG